MSHSRRWRWWIIAALFLTAGTASAREFLQANRCRVLPGEVVRGTLFVLCQELTIDGIVEGNLIGVATNAVIHGEVRNGVYLLGGQLDVDGQIFDDLHYLGVVLRLLPGAQLLDPQTDLFALTLTSETASDVRLPGDVLAVGYQLLLNGAVGGEVNFWGSALEIHDTIGGDVIAQVGDPNAVEGMTQLETLFLPFRSFNVNLVASGLRVLPSATLRGDLRYLAPAAGTLQGTLEGELDFRQVLLPQIVLDEEKSLLANAQHYLSASLREFITLAVVGMLGLLVFPALTQAPIRNLRRRPLTSLGVGTLTFILSFPVVLITVLISLLVLFSLSLLQVSNLLVAGAVVLTLLNVGGASLFYFVAIFVARSIVCLAVGRLLLRQVLRDDDTLRYQSMRLLFGALLVGAAVTLPTVGWVINALTLFVGLGAIVNLIQAQLRVIREQNSDAPRSRTIALAELRARSPLPTVAVEVPPRPQHDIGTDNLPPDFVWWD
ncbi:MAG: hypothetical protein ACOYL5_01750 [Phototrophicaceae bacterium]